jgi:hypothetical protein
MIVGVHKVEQCNFTKVGLERGDGRRSYVLSFFGKQIQQTPQSAGPRSRWDCPVEIIDTVIDNRAEWTPKLRGAVLCEMRPHLVIAGCDISHDGPADRPLVLSDETKIVVLDRNRFHGSKQIRLVEPDEVHITGNTGSIPVEIIKNGITTKIGPVSQDFHMAA